MFVSDNLEFTIWSFPMHPDHPDLLFRNAISGPLSNRLTPTSPSSIAPSSSSPSESFIKWQLFSKRWFQKAWSFYHWKEISSFLWNDQVFVYPLIKCFQGFEFLNRKRLFNPIRRIIWKTQKRIGYKVPEVTDNILLYFDLSSLPIAYTPFPSWWEEEDCCYHKMCLKHFTDLGKLKLQMVVWFKAQVNFQYCPSCLLKWCLIQKWSKLTQR